MTVRVSNGQYLTVLDPQPLDNVGWYARVLSQRDYATQIALVERFTEIGFTKEESGVGGAKIVLDADDPIFSTALPLGETDKLQDQEALWQLIEDGIVRFEFLAEDLQENVLPNEDGLKDVTLTGRGTGLVLEWAKVMPAGMPNPTSMDRTFNAAPMAVWATLFAEAQADGFLPFVSLTFDAVNDSSATPWGPAQALTVQAGTSLLDLLTQYCEANDYAWKMLPGFRVHVLKNPGQLISSKVVFTQAKDQDLHDRAETRREVANVVYAAGSDGLAVSTDLDSQTKWRKRAVWLSAGGSDDATSRSAVANAHLTLHKDPMKSRTIKVAPYEKGKRVFVDFDVSDEIGVEEVAENGPTPMRVKAVSVKVGEDSNPEVELTMMSRFEARMVKLAKMLDKLGGSEQGEGTAPIPVSAMLQATKLADLSDIATAGVLTGDVLSFQSGQWVDKTPNLNFLTDVDTVTVPPTNGQTLVYDNAVGLWKPGGGAGSSVAMKWRGAWSAAGGVASNVTFDSGTIPAGWVSTGGAALVQTKADATAGTTKAMTNADITDGQTTYTEFTHVWAGTSPLVVRYWLESESGFDFFRVYVDGVQQLSDSGNAGVWKVATIPMTAGSHVIRFQYSKDGSASVGGDAYWLSKVTLQVPDPSFVPYAVGDVVTYGGQTWIFTGTATGAVPGATGDWTALSPAAGGGGGGSAPVLRTQASNYNAASSTASITIPASAAIGDMLVVAVNGDWSVSNTAVTGWTFLGAANGSNTNVSVFARLCQSGDAGSTVNFTMAGGTSWNTWIAVVNGGKLVRGQQMTQGASGATQALGTELKPIGGNDLVLMFGWTRTASKTVQFDMGTVVADRSTDSNHSSTLWTVTSRIAAKPTVTTAGGGSTGGLCLAVVAVGS